MPISDPPEPPIEELSVHDRPTDPCLPPDDEDSGDPMFVGGAIAVVHVDDGYGNPVPGKPFDPSRGSAFSDTDEL